MAGKQLSLWDNISLEKGMRCLLTMELDGAIEHFSDSLASGMGERQKTIRYIDISRFWNERIRLPEGNALSDGFLAVLVTDIGSFTFPREMIGLKRSLLSYVAGLAPNVPDVSFKTTEMLFDMLVQEKEYVMADKMLQEYHQYAHMNKVLPYLMAQAKWLIDEHTESNRIYTIALLTGPENLPLMRIENPRLRELIISVGASMAPAYGWIRNILPFVPVDTLSTTDSPETHALQCYRLLQKCQKALKLNDMPSCIGYRKQLKSLSPELYEAYFNLLKFKKSGSGDSASV